LLKTEILLIKPKADTNMKFWQIYGKSKFTITSTNHNFGEICDIL